MKTCIIMGCGPSLAALQVKRLPNHVHTFGMKNAWKYFQRLKWWPTYYANLDKKSEDYNREPLVEIIKDPSVLTRTFFLHEKVCESDRIEVVRYRRGLFDFGASMGDLGDGGNSATNAAQIAVALGYTQIALVGVDLNYGAENEYFISDYHKDGEPVNEHQVETYHNHAWVLFAKWAKKRGVLVVNCGRQSTLKCFTFQNLASVLKKAT